MSDDYPVILYEWDGDHMVPLQRFVGVCNKQFVVHGRYALVRREGRSKISHDHYHACVHDVWQNLPEDLAERHPNPDHLRKHALIKCGFADEHSIVCASVAEAQRIAAFIAPIDSYSIVTVKGPVVTRYTAKSQALRAMGKKDFQASKQAVLEYLSNLIGVKPEMLGQRSAA
jgi:hypothetical protein